MKIACLGWGSLVWDPRTLPIQGAWFEDGPFAPIEFTRQSSNGRITLVIDPSAATVRVLWAVMSSPDLQTCKQALKDREGITAEDWERLIGSWQRGHAAPANIANVPTWAEVKGVDAVIWTALGPRFSKEEISPAVDQVIEYLRGLTGRKRDLAREYIECAPRQIDTEYRRRIEAALGWTFRRR